ncbi:hypothetical protein AVEN_41370-1 [Araneus ventricosus]|uniref:Tc1-like transposase DDE domain-containing protein n=1 Tax=Araneus ventricosus TaxID=182803 RepID=A0A4Y2T7L6_ARAVE|nr:hypothetical protein AVEN_12162-1 [Araneus ventricosus]GBN96640.1 hypothetical protein AVEN_41370-1 [Araneus ventricosus]
MIEVLAFPQLENVQPNIIFQKGRAPAHWNLEVQNILEEKLPRRWIERGGPIPWPPRSSDLTPLDFFSWGYVKNIVHQSPMCDTDELKS